MSVEWLSSALADVTRIVRHIKEENPFAARKVARELLLAGDSLAVFPNRGRPGRVAGTRELVAVLPYIIVYEANGMGKVSILRVWHGSQENRN